MPSGGYSTGLAEPTARSVQEICDQGRRVTFTWFDPPFRPEPPHSNQAYGICFTRAGMIVLGACDAGGERYWNLLGGGVEPGERWRTAWSGKLWRRAALASSRAATTAASALTTM